MFKIGKKEKKKKVIYLALQEDKSPIGFIKEPEFLAFYYFVDFNQEVF